MCNAPSTFHRMMDMVLGELRWTTCLVYMDDVVVYRKDFKEHNDRLMKLLRCLAAAGLKLRMSKCFFGHGKLKVLGHIVSALGIMPDADKVKAVREFPEPSEHQSQAARLPEARAGLCRSMLVL